MKKTAGTTKATRMQGLYSCYSQLLTDGPPRYSG
jgi:hypothetical protein